MPRQTATPKKIHFTKKVIDSLVVTKTTFFYDEDAKGLSIRVSPAGNKSFYIVRWDPIKQYSQRTLLGQYPEMTIDQARRLVIEKSALAVKIDVMRQTGSNVDLTFSDLFARYSERAELDLRTYKTHTHAHYKRHFKLWYTRKVFSITKEEVQTWINLLGKNTGKRTANHCHSIMRAIINWGIDDGCVTTLNPCHKIKRFKIPPKVRFLKPGDEFNRFVDALKRFRNRDAADLFAMLLWTGGRLGNVLRMSWHDIHMKTKLWVIPSDKAKNQDIQSIPFSKHAMEILERRFKSKTSENFVFGFPNGDFLRVSWWWPKFLKLAKIENLTPHDLRHTMGSYMAMSGANVQTIAKALGHRSLRSTEIYMHLMKQPVRIAVEKAIDSMFDPSLILGNAA